VRSVQGAHAAGQRVDPAGSALWRRSALPLEIGTDVTLEVKTNPIGWASFLEPRARTIA
jgi:hypothetical protein